MLRFITKHCLYWSLNQYYIIMKKLLLSLSFTLLIGLSGISAQEILDDFDSYDLGTISAQADHWITWDLVEGSAAEAYVVDEQSASAPNSLRVAEGGAEDILLLLGDVYDSGVYALGWNMYIPSGKTGYYNHQESQTPGDGWNFDVFFNMDGAAPGTATMVEGTAEIGTFAYPEDEWFYVSHLINLDAGTMELFINGESVYTMIYNYTIGSINFYSIDADNRIYLDDVVFQEADFTSIQEDNLANVSVFPNPANDLTYIDLSTIGAAQIQYELYDLAGNRMQSDVFTNNGIQEIQTNGLSSGLYLMRLSTESSEKIFKLAVR